MHSFASAAEDYEALKKQAVDTLIAIIAKYESRIQVLESENTALRAKLNIATGATVVTSSGTLVAVSSNADKELANIKSSTPVFAAVVEKMNKALPNMRKTFTLPDTTSIIAFEFVTKSATEHGVYVDVDFGDDASLSGAYDGKILFNYNPGDISPKFVGWFKYDKAARKYVTVQWVNAYIGSTRTIIANPYAGNPNPVIVDVTSGASQTTTSTTVSGTTSNTSSTGVFTSSGVKISFSDIQKAYNDKRYLSVINLSNTYLQTNAPTVDVLRIRYRTYFIIGKFQDSLNEITKIEALQSKLDRTIACDAAVIANYQKNTDLSSKYDKICKS